MTEGELTLQSAVVWLVAMASSGGYLKSSAKKSHFVVLYSTGNEEEYPAKDLEARLAIFCCHGICLSQCTIFFPLVV